MLASMIAMCWSVTPMAQTDKSVSAGDAIISYTVTDSLMSISVRTLDSVMITEQLLSPVFWDHITAFRRKLATADITGFYRLGQILYVNLIYPVEKMLRGKKRLIIITPEPFAGVPFEALVMLCDPLITNEGQCYLIHDYEVEYRLPETRKITRLPAEPPVDSSAAGNVYAFVGFSPGFIDHPGIAPLPASKQEVVEITGLFRERGLPYWLGSEEYSAKREIMAVASRTKILHLATHFISHGSGGLPGGFLCGDYRSPLPGMNMTDGILTLEEIASIPIHADLVVLNACRTGIYRDCDNGGKSVPETFIRAGARNILSTLWNITDRLAGKFMVEFYGFLLSGRTACESLRAAKLRMINNPETSLPVVWAPYVLTSR